METVKKRAVVLLRELADFPRWSPSGNNPKDTMLIEVDGLWIVRFRQWLRDEVQNGR